MLAFRSTPPHENKCSLTKSGQWRNPPFWDGEVLSNPTPAHDDWTEWQLTKPHDGYQSLNPVPISRSFFQFRNFRTVFIISCFAIMGVILEQYYSSCENVEDFIRQIYCCSKAHSMDMVASKPFRWPLFGPKWCPKSYVCLSTRSTIYQHSIVISTNAMNSMECLQILDRL